jgi:hypothetical protein
MENENRNYRIRSAGGDYDMIVTPNKGGYMGRVIVHESNPLNEIVLTGRSEDEIFANCRNWGSRNIVGEFSIIKEQ